jgi:hypothetical protein
MNDIRMKPIGEFSADSLLDRDGLGSRPPEPGRYRALSSKEIEILVKNHNTAESWDRILVAGHFDPRLVRGCEFWGLVRLGSLAPKYLEFNELRLPVGLQNSTIISCDIGSNVAVRNVHHLSHFTIGSQVILFNIDEMVTVDHAKFGNGVVKEGEPEEVRVWLEVANENGGRRILPFAGILPADATLWARYRERPELLDRFREMTDRLGGTRRGFYGRIGDRSVIKNSRILKDTMIGTDCYIKGANKLKNLTIQSSAEEPTQIGEGVELVNGIVGYGNRIFYGVKAVRFVTGRNVQLKYGARLLNSVLGDNSTVSCCELLNNLIFPFHEQHHNNSFLIATTVMGQSNIAAGACIGSNHNSRAPDGEIVAGRGFWPGLETSFKHNSRFASFCLIARGSYPWEMDIPLPFSLVSLAADGGLQVMPGYWFRHNLYALERNSAKFLARDKRVVREQHIEYDYLAPDTAEEMLAGMDLLLAEIRRALPREEIQPGDLLESGGELESRLDLRIDGLAAGCRARIVRPLQGYRLYRRMLIYYGGRELAAMVEKLPEPGRATCGESEAEPCGTGVPLSGSAGGREPPAGAGGLAERIRQEVRPACRAWTSLGGQLVPQDSVQSLLEAIQQGQVGGWDEVHQAYDRAWAEYPRRRRDHAIFCALQVKGFTLQQLTEERIAEILRESAEIARELLVLARESRAKDYTNPFRRMTYRSPAEMDAVLGRLEDNAFLREMRGRIETFAAGAERLADALASAAGRTPGGAAPTQ